MRRAAFAMLLVVTALPDVAAAVDYPTRKPGLWELTMTMTSGRTMTTSQCTDESTDKDMITSAGPSMQQSCKRSELQKTASGYVSDSTCTFNNMTMVSHTEVSGDFNSAYTVKVTSHNSGGAPTMPADTNMTMAAKWLGPCKADQKPGDMIMPGGMKMNIKDLQSMRNQLPK